jgi:enoyl-CoA hydratase/carnithine racemase
VIVIGHGLVVGGGVGLLVGGAARIVTETAQISMPEISIGLFPDVGVSKFLDHMPEKLGLFLALTGARLTPGDALLAGLADSFIPQARLDDLVTALEEHEWTDDDAMDRDVAKEVVARFATPFVGDVPAAEVTSRLPTINNALQGADPRAALQRLAALAKSPDPWLAKACEAFTKGSPLSAFVIHEQMRRVSALSLEGTFGQDLTLARAFLRGHDFLEGVRAVLIDKDQKPRWQPATLESVTREQVESHFST